MPAGDDLDAGALGELRAVPAGLNGVPGKGRKHVALGRRLRAVHERGDPRSKLGEELLPERALDLGGALLGRERLVLVLLEFGCDETLDVLQGLTAPVLCGHLVGLALGNFDVIAGNAVVFNAKG